MTGLSSLSPEDADLVAGLPYRVGIWMSGIDAEGGPEFNPKELEALEKMLVKAAQDKASVTGAIARETLKRKTHWVAWTKSAHDVLPDCERAQALLKPVLSQGDAKAFRQWLLKIAAGVAGAFGEFGDGEDHTGFIGRGMNNLTEFVSGHIPTGNPLHISPAEDDALQRLGATLGLWHLRQ